MNPRTRTAITMNCVVGIPVILSLSALNALVHFPTPTETALSNAALGFSVSFFMVYLSLRGFVERWVRAAT